MHAKSQISQTRKTLHMIMLFGVILSTFGTGNLIIARAQESQPSTMQSWNSPSSCDNPNDYTCEQWYLTQTGVRSAWQNPNYRGSSDVIVAVLDTGVDYNHEDLLTNMWVNTGEIPNDGIDNDGNGYKDDSNGWDLIDTPNDGDPSPGSNTGSWHGTAVAGIIGAVHDNQKGVDGINWHVKIMPIRVIRGDENSISPVGCGTGLLSGTRQKIADGIDYAVKNKANIINISIAVKKPNYLIPGEDCVDKAVSKATLAGVLIVAGSGDGNTSSPSVVYPAELVSVISVGSTDQQDHRATFPDGTISSYGDALDVVAPGLNIPILLPGNQYTDSGWGTSFSAPQVAGLAALIMAANRKLKASQVRGYIEAYAEEVGEYPYQNGFHPEMGWGRINAYASLMAAAPPSVQSCPQTGGVLLYYNANYDCNGLGENNGYTQRSSAGWQNITNSMNENASSVIMPSGWSVLLYENADRGGGKKCLNSTDSWLSDFNYLGNFPGTGTTVADHASSFEVFTSSGCGTIAIPPPQPTDGVEVCDLANYGAPCKTYTYVNNSTCTNLNSDGWNDRIESMRFKGSYISSYDMILYDDNSCGTYIARYGSDAISLGNLNNLAGSFRIEQHGPALPPPDPTDGINLYDGTNWGGQTKRYTFSNNSYCIDLNNDGWSNRADSIKFFGAYVSNYDIILYDDAACNTYNARYGTDAFDLGPFNHKISSIRIEQHAIIIPPPPSGSIKLWDGSGYSGSNNQFTYVANDYCTNLAPYGWDNRARSLQFISGYVGEFDVILYDDNGCSVYNARYGSDASDLGAFNGKISSIRIERHSPPRPDLIPDPRSGRSTPVVISPVSGTNTNDVLYAGEPIYIDWGFKNNGSVNAMAHNVKLTIDGQTIIDYPFGGLNTGKSSGFDDWSTTWVTPGTFTVSLIVDSNAAVDESDEGNNIWSGQFTWNMRPPNQFTKSTPLISAIDQLPSLDLTWTESSGVNNYEYCLDTFNDNTCNDSWINVGTSISANTSATPGTTYYWQVRAKNSGNDPTYADGNTWWSFNTLPPVPNDDFYSATQISNPIYSGAQSTTGATSTSDDPVFTCISDQKYNTTWYQYTASSDGLLNINTFGSSFDTVLGVWTGNKGNLLSQACNDDTSGLQSEVQLQVVAGVTYYIEVAGYSSNSYGSIKLSVGPSASCPTITDWKGEYWTNPSLAGTPSLCRNDPDLNLDWGLGSPDPIIPDDNFSARWTKTVNFSNGTYRFHTRHDDGVRIYIDNILKLDAWDTCCVWDTVDAKLFTGPHTIRVELFDIGGASHAQLWWEQISSSTFTDVPPTYWASNYIERLFNAGITSGCGAGIYCPDNSVTRAQMAVFLLKGMHGSDFTPPAINGISGFFDVATDHWAAAWIKQLSAEGITSGCGNGNYCPEATVTRAQMAVFLLKAKHGSSYSPPTATGVFTDVPTGYWADKWIERLAAEGITSGCGNGNYCPDDSVTRAQMAVFLVKAFGLP